MNARSVLITGCSSGIGLAAARDLRARGWRVFPTVRRPDHVERLAAEGFEAVRLDYADEASIAEAVQTVLEATGGRLTALFNNGAYGQPGAIEDIETHVLRAQFEANFFGWHTLTRAVIPFMRAAGEGRIVNCSSVLGLVALKYRGPYNATKFALEGYTDTLRLELRGTGIHVSLIEPGPIATRFAENALAAFRRNVDAEASPHREVYARRTARMENGGASTFKLQPDAVVRKLVHALESSRPRPRYFVTKPTWIMETARRFLPGRARDAFLAAVSDREA